MSDGPGPQGDARPLRVGVVGVGWPGERHLEAYAEQPGVEIAALAGLEQDRLARFGTQYGVSHLTRDYRELCEREDLDAVSVCTPNHLHAPIAIALLDSGKHVLCEKPLARTGPEAEGIVDAAVRSGRVLQVVFNHRARGDVQVLKQHLGGGGLGQIYHVKATWMRRRWVPGGRTWFTNFEMAGGGPLIDLGVHVLDLALYLLDEPDVATVSAATYAALGRRGQRPPTGAPTVNGDEVEDLATAFLRLRNGATLLLEASWAVHGRAGDDFGVTLYGTEGGAEIAVKNYSWEDTLRIYSDVAGVASEIRPRVTRGEGHRAVVRDFVAAIRHGDGPPPAGQDGLKRARIIDACYASALQGREFALDESGRILHGAA